jgi:hypothetical protein
MEINADELLSRAIHDGIRESVTDKLKGYNSPIDKLLTAAIEKHNSAFRELLENAIGSAVADDEFRNHIAAAVRSNLAKTLVQRFGGEIEKQVNVLKSDPMTRARIVLAIEEIVKSHKET